MLVSVLLVSIVCVSELYSTFSDVGVDLHRCRFPIGSYDVRITSYIIGVYGKSVDNQLVN